MVNNTFLLKVHFFLFYIFSTDISNKSPISRQLSGQRRSRELVLGGGVTI